MAVAGFASWHENHLVARKLLDRGPHIVAHAALETYSVLTRLPAPHRAERSLVSEFLRQRFPMEPLALKPAALRELIHTLAELGIDGGAVYDALIAFTTRESRAVLQTLDHRAAATYRRCDTEFELIA